MSCWPIFAVVMILGPSYQLLGYSEWEPTLSWLLPLRPLIATWPLQVGLAAIAVYRAVKSGQPIWAIVVITILSIVAIGWSLSGMLPPVR